MSRHIAVAALILFVVAGGCGHRQPAPGSDITAEVPPALLPPATPEAAPEYRLAVGDEFDVKFPYHPDMGVSTFVRPDGRIDLPPTGEISVIGLTVDEMHKLILERSRETLRNPEVVILLRKVADQRVFVGGQVVRPGSIVLRPGMTMLQAIMVAGGTVPGAKRESTLLMTQTPGGKFAAARVDMAQVEDEGVVERIRLHPNDVIYVPKSFINDANEFVDLWIRGLIPVLPHVGVGYNPASANN
jgi:protein involved in polysaccharide export with SLBB domain